MKRNKAGCPKHDVFAFSTVGYMCTIKTPAQCDRLVKYMQQSVASLCFFFKSLCKCKHSPVSGRFDTLL